MGDWVAMIDESGSFGRLNRRGGPSFVGGWIAPATFVRRLPGALDALGSRFNADLPPGEPRLDARRDLHFFPLHLPNLRVGADAHISLDPRHAPTVMRAVFELIGEQTLLAFRSTGTPRLAANEQDAYLQVLRATLVQLLDLPDFDPDSADRGTSLRIVIASRRQPELLGYEGGDDPDAYEDHLAGRLSRELDEAMRGPNKPRISVAFESARREVGLAVADLICGSFRMADGGREFGYLQPLHSAGRLRRLAVADGPVEVGPRPIQRLAYACRADPVGGAEQLLEAIGEDPDDGELRRLLPVIVGRFTRRDEIEFAADAATEIELSLSDAADRYRRLQRSAAMIEALGESLDGWAAGPPHRQRLIERLERAKLRVAAMRGEADPAGGDAWRQLHAALAPTAFASRADRLVARLDGDLWSARVRLLNALEPELIDDALRRTRDKYTAAFGDDEGPDVLLSRLDRILGDACRLAGQVGNAELGELAPAFLDSAVDLSPPGSADHRDAVIARAALAGALPADVEPDDDGRLPLAARADDFEPAALTGLPGELPVVRAATRAAAARLDAGDRKAALGLLEPYFDPPTGAGRDTFGARLVRVPLRALCVIAESPRRRHAETATIDGLRDWAFERLPHRGDDRAAPAMFAIIDRLRAAAPARELAEAVPAPFAW
jgi:hypothetical protein